jgi:hypothetical protein
MELLDCIIDLAALPSPIRFPPRSVLSSACCFMCSSEGPAMRSARAPPVAGSVTWEMAVFTGFVLLVASLNALVLVFGGPIGWAVELVVRL